MILICQTGGGGLQVLSIVIDAAVDRSLGLKACEETGMQCLKKKNRLG